MWPYESIARCCCSLTPSQGVFAPTREMVTSPFCATETWSWKEGGGPITVGGTDAGLGGATDRGAYEGRITGVVEE
jgi:hypothetical protein